jgi:hypothetical protein
MMKHGSILFFSSCDEMALPGRCFSVLVGYSLLWGCMKGIVALLA